MLVRTDGFFFINAGIASLAALFLARPLAAILLDEVSDQG